MDTTGDTMNSSSMDITVTCNTYENTISEYNTLQHGKHEVINQEIYELRQKNGLLEKMYYEASDEVAFLTSVNEQDKSNLEELQTNLNCANAKIKQLELILQEEKQHFQMYEEEVNNNNNKITDIKPTIVPDLEQLNILRKQIQRLEAQHADNQLAITDMLVNKAASDHEKHQLNCKIRALQTELTEVKEHLEIKSHDLQSLREALESTQEEKLLLHTELEKLKVSDGIASRGNSLFAEVDEKRQNVTAQREYLKMKYFNLKKMLGLKQVEINKLKMELVNIRREDKDNEQRIYLDYSNFFNSYKERVSQLEYELKTMEQKYQEAAKVDQSAPDWITTVIASARKEAVALQAELDRRVSNYVTQAHELLDSQKENRRLKKKISIMQSEFDELQLQMDNKKAASEKVDDGFSPPVKYLAKEYKAKKKVKFNNPVLEEECVDK